MTKRSSTSFTAADRRARRLRIEPRPGERRVRWQVVPATGDRPPVESEGEAYDGAHGVIVRGRLLAPAKHAHVQWDPARAYGAAFVESLTKALAMLSRGPRETAAELQARLDVAQKKAAKAAKDPTVWFDSWEPGAAG